jgi:hypothetical protein
VGVLLSEPRSTGLATGSVWAAAGTDRRRGFCSYGNRSIMTIIVTADAQTTRKQKTKAKRRMERSLLVYCTDNTEVADRTDYTEATDRSSA